MKKLSWLTVLLLALTPCSYAADCFENVIRVTALVRLEGKAKVGIVESANSNSAFLAEGGKMAGIEVVAIDYEKEVVTFKRGSNVCVLALAGDPNAPKFALVASDGRGPDSPDWRGEAIEKFLRENPDALREGEIKLVGMGDLPPVTGRGPGIDGILAQNPEAARMAEKEAVGKGEGIEAFLKANNIKVDDAPIPEGSLGPGIEEAMKKAGYVVETNGFFALPDVPEPAPTPVKP